MKKLLFVAVVLAICSPILANPFTPPSVNTATKPNAAPNKKQSIQFMHSAGIGYLAVFDDVDGLGGWAAAYTPMLVKPTSKYSGLALTAPLLFSASISSQYGTSAIIDLPVTIEYGFGYGSTEKAYKKDFGMFIGAGAGATVVSAGYYTGGAFLSSTMYAGGRFEIADRPIDLRFGYGFALGETWKGVNKFNMTACYILSYQ